jgi:type I restriction enzyme, S subunit
MNETEQLPSGWAVANLEDAFDILDGQRVPVNAKERAKRAGNIPYYGATGRVGWIDDYLFDERLVLLGEDGAPFFDKTRHVAYLISGKSWVNNHAHVLRPCGGLTASLFAHQLNVIDYHAYVGGTTRWKLNQAPMRKIQLRIPPSKEQERIADALDELMSDLDAGVAALDRVREKLKLFRASVLKAAVEGTLTAEWRKQHPQVEPAPELLKRILAERRRRWEEQQLSNFKEKGREPPENWKTKYIEPNAPAIDKLPVLPERWCWASLDQVFRVERGRFSVRPRNDPRYYGGDVPFVQIGELPREGGLIRTYNQTLNEAGLSVSKKFPAGTVLIAIVGATIGNTGILSFDSCCPDSLVALQSTSSALLRFAELFLQTKKLGLRLAASASGGQPNINLELLQPLAIPLAPAEEIEVIVDEAEDRLSIIDHLEADIDAKLENTQALRQSILRHAFGGKLVPQDLNDEPASELLKRIAAEREQRAREAIAAKRLNARKPRRASRARARSKAGVAATKETDNGRIADR